MPARSAKSEEQSANDDEITIERRVKVTDVDRELHQRKTTKMGAVDARLLAIARGDIEPEQACELFVIDDPFGGLIPVNDDDELLQLDDDWLLEEVDFEETTDFSSAQQISRSATPRLCMRAAEIVALPLDHRSGFLLSHIDGKRTVEEVIDVSHLSPPDTLEVIASLIMLGAITID
ncbi:MAG TPA: hypothetical protein VLT33_23845 [Labilithrix sp.]|nr:hypothetical protein [Labilithrix sp.]